MVLKLVKHTNPIGAMKIFTKTDFNICMEGRITILKNVPDRYGTLMNNTLENYGSYWHKTTDYYQRTLYT